MGRQTQPFRRSMSGSIGAGVKSVLGGDGRRFYVLEHKVSSKYHHAGEEQKIIVDQVEIGRDSTCAVRLDGEPDDKMFQIVSRKHAAIERNGDNWTLVHLSTTNSTFLNGRRLSTPGQKWYLQNGDEIQIAESGPKLGFKIPQGDKSLVKSIGLTARLNLFRKQALRPYKQAISALGCVLLLLSVAGGYALYEQHKIIKEQERAIAEAQERFDKEKALQDSIINNLTVANAGLVADAKERDRVINELKTRVDEAINRPVTPPVVSSVIDNKAIEPCLPHIYYIQTVKFDVIMPNGERISADCGNGENDMPGWSGTGFMLSNGKFVTARHVAEGWYFWRDGNGANEKLGVLNAIANNGGKVVCHFIAISSAGTKLTFTSDQFIVDRSHDQIGNTDDGTRLSLARLDNTDYAYLKASGSGLSYDGAKCNELERGTKLTVLGFPLGLGANSPTDINPIYGSGIVSVPGLQNGVILTTDTNYEQGNSGGPVFYTDDNGKLVVIGIVSAGAGRNTGFVVPISVIN